MAHRGSAAEVTVVSKYLGIVRYTGILTLTDMLFLAPRVLSLTDELDPVLVVDYTCCMPALTVDDLMAVVLTYRHRRGRVMALVVPRQYADMYRQFAWEGARHGKLRAVFTDFSEAVVWAQDQALDRCCLMAGDPAMCEV